MPDHLDPYTEALHAIDNRLTSIETLLGERCKDHQRQIDELKKRNGNGATSSAWSDPKIIAAIVVGLTALISGVLAFFGVRV